MLNVIDKYFKFSKNIQQKIARNFTSNLVLSLPLENFNFAKPIHIYFYLIFLSYIIILYFILYIFLSFQSNL